MIRLILFLILKFVLGAESGASLPWSSKWQNKKPWLSELPEALDALILACIAVRGFAYMFDLTDLYSFGYYPYYAALSLGAWLYIPFFAICYAGIQSATWTFLRWETHDDPNTERSSTLKPIVDKVSEWFGWSIGQEGYSWTAAAVKGTIITLPLGGLGGIAFACGYEIGSWFKRKGRDKYLPPWLTPHAVAEGMSFVGVGLYSMAFIKACQFIGGMYGIN